MEGEPEPRHLQARKRFKSLLAVNPNHFGTAPGFGGPPQLELAQDTAFEELTCVGYNPFLGQLEATVHVKLPGGYNGDLCHAGSTEWIRFFADFGSGWQDVGLTGFNAHDIPTAADCAGERNKPLSYVATLPFRPPGRFCARPLLPNILAILSWENVPTAGDPTFIPVWGNRLERHIQIAPRRRPVVVDVLDELEAKLPKELEFIEQIPIDLPDPPPPDFAELAEAYKGGGKEAAAAAGEPQAVEPHRFGFESLQAALAPGAFGTQPLGTLAQQWKQYGLDFAAAVAVLEKTSGDVGYEEVTCVGLDYNREILAATFVIKRPTGYSGTLCQHGSTEYVAFWADWDDTCKYEYVGTAQVQVHDIAGIPPDGLHYAAFVPATGIDRHRQRCERPKIARIRAVLSWATPPSTTDPDDVPHWGNRLDAHVQIRPGVPEPPFDARIRNIGGIAVEDIDTGPGGTGMTLTGGPPVHFAHFPSLADSLGRACPFGGLVIVEGQFFLGHRYRVSVRRETDPPGVVSYLTTPFDVERVTFGYSHQVAGAGGFFNYLDPAAHFDRTLALWYTSGDERWIVQLEIRDPANNPHFSPQYTIQLDNTAPFVDVEITSPGGDCADFAQGTTVQGRFVAQDANFGSWSLATLPNSATIPSNQPVPAVGLLPTTPTPPRVPPPPAVPWTGGHGWSVDTGNPVQMRPCGYVVQVAAADRAIVGSHPGGHNRSQTETGFCLRKP